MGILRSGAATVAVVGVLCFGVPVAETAQADTSVTVLKLLATAATGGGMGVASAPEDAAAIGAVCATGVGCAVLGAAAVGAALYATQDTWVPWLKNAFGAGGTSTTGEGCGTKWCGYWNAQPIAGVLGGGFSYNVSTVGTPGVVEAQTSWIIGCVDSGGAPHTYTVTKNLEMGSWVGGNYSGTIVVTNPCAGGSITGLTADASANGGNGPVMTWGTTPPLTDAGTHISNQVSCVNPDGSTFSVTQGVTGVTGSLAPMPTCTGAAGSQPGAHGQCVTTSAGPAGGALTVQSSNCAAVGSMAALYPNCVGVGAASCSYVVRVDGMPCAVGVPACVSWEGTAALDPSRVACDYGPYVVALANCDLLKRLYETGTVPATGLNTDGHPDTYTAPGPSGQPSDNPSPSPTPTAGLALPLPNPAGVPGTIAAPTGPTTASEQNCWPSGYGMFNPSNWVLQPVKCALVWAFVPSSVFLAGWGGSMSDGFNASPLGSWINSLGAFGHMSIASGGCQGPGLSTGFLGTVGGQIHDGTTGPIVAATIYPFSACSGVMATVAATSNLILTAGISFFGGMRVIQQLGYAFGFKVHVGSERGSFT
jgi:hypothetical protein